MYRFLALESLDVKVLLASVGLSIAAPIDLVFRFLIPIISGVCWVFLKPMVVKFRLKVVSKKKLKKSNEQTNS